VNRLLDAGAEALSAALKARAESNPEDDVHLDLAIGSNLIGDAGAEAVAAALAVGPALTGLCLEYNKVGSTGAEALAAAVRARCAKGWPRPIVRFTGNHMDGGSAFALQNVMDEFGGAKGTLEPPSKRRRTSS